MKRNSSSVTVETSTGSHLLIAPVAPYAFHIRVNRTGRFEKPAPLNRLGIIPTPETSIRFEIEDLGTRLQLNAEEASLQVDRLNGEVTLCNRAGTALTRQIKPPLRGGPGGFEVRFALLSEERIYGLGDQYDAPLMKRGCQISINLRGNRVHAPVPFLLSSKGWALLVDTDQEHEFDVGRSSPDELHIQGKRGELAYYLIAGGNLADLLRKYGELTGPSVLLPIWAYGLTFICNQQTTARDMIEDALKFRREGIPCDMIGLEPTWMDRPFDYESPVQWHPDRFYIPQWMPEGAHTFMGALQTMGFKLSLGLYLRDYAGTENKRGYAESWYEYLRPFVAQGVQGFKLGTKLPVQEQARIPAFADEGTEAASLMEPSIVSRDIQEGFAEQTGRRAMVYTPVGYSGIQKYAAIWSGGRQQPHLSMLNLGLSGIPHMSVAMNLHSPAGIHFGFFQPWTKVNSWAYWRHPLLLDPHLLGVFKTYAKLRYRLLPYIYSAANVAVRIGLPIARAMPIAYPDDAQAVSLQNQYMFGDDFLVAVFTDQVYLPDGEWLDYWTGERHTGPTTLTYGTPRHVGGPLFVRPGAILPMWPDMEYAGQQPPDRMELHLYPGSDREYTLYEDDGVSLDYKKGGFAETKIRCWYNRKGFTVEIGPQAGSYRNMPEQRSWEIVVHSLDMPAEVKVDGEECRKALGSRKDLLPGCWSFHRKTGTIRLVIVDTPESRLTPIRLELVYSAGREIRKSVTRQARIGSSRGTAGEMEKEIEIGLETGDLDKALSALEQWWKVRTAEANSMEEVREHWLYMNGLFVRSVERRGRTLSEVVEEDHLRESQLQPADRAEQAYGSLVRIAGLIVEYDNRQRGKTHEIVRQATDIIMQEINQELSLHAVADRLHLNSSYLSRRFKKEIGQSFSDYVLEKKMELAKELLLSGATVISTADHTGFKEPSYFIRVFRKYWGVTPGEMKP